MCHDMCAVADEGGGMTKLRGPSPRPEREPASPVDSDSAFSRSGGDGTEPGDDEQRIPGGGASRGKSECVADLRGPDWWSQREKVR